MTKRALSQATKRWASQQGPLATWLAKEAERYLRKFHNRDFEFSTNGEFWLLSRHANARTVFDVGANDGQWSLAAASFCPSATVHSFEILPETFERLKANVGSHPRIHINEVGLSDRVGEAEVHVHPHSRCLTSLIPGGDLIHQASHRTERVELIRGDDYCRSHGIEAIDLLKIDTEGAEHLVLSGFKDMLVAGKIGTIQFEFTMHNIFSRFLLRDFYDLLQPLGFSIGKLFPNRVDFRSYRPEDDNFTGPNFVAALDTEL